MNKLNPTHGKKISGNQQLPVLIEELSQIKSNKVLKFRLLTETFAFP